MVSLPSCFTSTRTVGVDDTASGKKNKRIGYLRAPFFAAAHVPSTRPEAGSSEPAGSITGLIVAT
jgi:hypothetical protein